MKSLAMVLLAVFIVGGIVAVAYYKHDKTTVAHYHAAQVAKQVRTLEQKTTSDTADALDAMAKQMKSGQ